MHEVGLCEAIVDATLKRANGRRVESVRVRIGGHPIDPEVIDQGFRIAAMGTVAADATVDLVVEPMVLHCHGCGANSPANDALGMVACPACGGIDVDLHGHEDVVLESISLRAPEEELA
ncbi:MAG: hydrogenase maturation nickel metallochaperone HypA [Acidothermaceae bacterium]